MRRMIGRSVVGAGLLAASACFRQVEARSWRDIVSHQEQEPTDPASSVYLMQKDQLYGNPPAPTANPSVSPPTTSPTYLSSPGPQNNQSTVPPITSAPTPELYPPMEVPLNPEAWYYNYDTRLSSAYGPGHPALRLVEGQQLMGYDDNAWGSVAEPPQFYWDEFTADAGFGPWRGVLQNRDVRRNRCGRVGMQSPIDVRPSGAACTEHHQVRSRPGDFRLKTSSIMKQILPNKLRLLYQRRNCADLSNPACQQPNPPLGDFPSGWSGFADALHVDFKVPSEHLLNGERFDGEMQIYYLNPVNRRLAVQVALIKATNEGYNYYFEQALQAFEEQYDADKEECLQSLARRRNLQRRHSLNATMPPHEDPVNLQNTSRMEAVLRSDSKRAGRALQTTPPIGVWNPQHEMLVPSIYFWRYDGSLTEPPCGEFVTWFISDKPMKISKDQLARVKHTLFTHIDTNCEQTSVHFDESVARPVQSAAGRPVWHCTNANFAPDTGIIQPQ